MWGKLPPFLYAIRVTNDTVITQDVEPYARIKLRLLRKRRPDISLRWMPMHAIEPKESLKTM